MPSHTDSVTAKLARNPEVDVSQLVLTRMGICANSGAGKSHALRLLLERVAGRIPVHVIDHEGEYVTLRQHLDAVMVSRVGGDLSPDPRTAFSLAKELRAAKVSVILDISDIHEATVRLRFVAQYLRGLLASDRASWSPTLVTIDEAHRFAPEVVSRGGSRELVESYHQCRAAVIALMDSGRKRELGGIVATQRFSKLAKDVLAEANNLLVGRFAQDTDLNRATKMLGLGSLSGTLKNFAPGEFYAQGPAFSCSGTLRIRTLRARSRPPREGGRISASRPSASVQRVLAQLEAVAPTPPSPPEVTEGAPGASEAQRARWVREGTMAERKRWSALLEDLHGMALGLPVVPVRELPVALEALARELRDARNGSSAPAPTSPSPKEHVSPKRQRKKSGRRSPKKANPSPEPTHIDPQEGLTITWRSAAGRILKVLLQHHPRKLPVAHVSPLAEVRHRRSTWGLALARLRKLDLVQGYPDGLLGVSPRAERYATEVDPLPSGDALIADWRARLGGARRRMFDALLDSPTGSLTKEELERQASVTPGASTLGLGIAHLRAVGLVAPANGSTIVLASSVLEARTSHSGS